MRDNTTGTAIVVILALTIGAWGCGSPAKAEPLELTYYYLPG